MFRKLAGLALIAFVVFFIATNPTGAASMAHHLGSLLAAAGHGAVTFVTAVVK